jgi:iron complex transport system ATP-binding protein
MSTPIVSLVNVGLHLDGRPIITDVSLELYPGEVLALVGPNGAGKSTLLSLMSGDVTPSTGSALLAGKEASKYRPDEAARVRSVLMQSNTVSFPFTVREIVEMGRAPWVRTAQIAQDNDAIAAALTRADIDHLKHRRFTHLSGGEKARVSFARVLAQRTPVVLLDEPTAALDLRHQEDVMTTVRNLAKDGTAVVVVVHDLSVAAGYADRVAMLVEGRLDAIGVPTDVIEANRVSRVYGVDVDIELVGRPPRPIILPRR